MGNKLSFYALSLALLAVFATGCTGGKKSEKKPEAVRETVAAPVIWQETLLLLKDLEENGDYVNSPYFPSLIKASIVNDELAKNNLIVDLRIPENYKRGHIKGAVNKNFSELADYFESGIKPFEYDRIIMVDDDGQVSSYATALLRMMGYGNVFAMRWGMGGWNKQYAEQSWLQGASGKYEDKLETSVNETPLAKEMPVINTGLASGKAIGEEIFRSLFKEGVNDILITADEVFNDPKAYFIINLDRKDKYDDGHIPGAVRYKPESTLGFTDMMATIPNDKTVVIYCGTGHNSAFASAFLRLFGYDARTLKYGNNSFMYDKMLKEEGTMSWLPFTLAETNDFAVVK